VAYRAQLRNAEEKEFEGGEEEHSRLVQETEHDYVALASAGAEAARLETTLERADREATEREVDLRRSWSGSCANSSPRWLLVSRLRDANGK